MPPLDLLGVTILKGLLDRPAQEAMVTALRHVAEAAPPVSPDTPYGRKMSVRMTSAGRFGWHSDRTGYRYLATRPGGGPWPPIPAEALALWTQTTDLARPPDCCLINFYGEGARMGLHQDRDEADFSWPVVSLSLGDDGLFRVGGSTRGGSTRSVWLQSGDVVILAGPSRLAYHGVDRIRFGSSDLLPKGGRINVTLRVVT